MGMGVNLDKDGHNVVFCGGTGSLVFLDIVARLVLLNCGVMPAEDRVFGENFCLSFYFAAPTREDAIGLKMCEDLQTLCEKLDKKNFKFNLRLSDASVKAPRWEKDFISKTLSAITGLKKVFVCGAPAMNETFDRTFEAIKGDLGLTWKDIEIL